MAHILKDIDAADVEAYLIKNGWERNKGFKNRNMMVFLRHCGEQTLALPAHKDMDDFYPNLERAVTRLAKMADKSKDEVIEDILDAGAEGADTDAKLLEHLTEIDPDDVEGVVSRTMKDANAGLREAVEILKKATEAEEQSEGDFWKKEFFSFLSSLTTTTHGKQMYFLQDDGKTVYSRISGKNLSLHEAESEYIAEIDREQGVM